MAERHWTMTNVLMTLTTTTPLNVGKVHKATPEDCMWKIHDVGNVVQLSYST